jgi:hypothetical protein
MKIEEDSSLEQLVSFMLYAFLPFVSKRSGHQSSIICLSASNDFF